MQRWTVAFVYSLKCHLREKDGLEAYVKDVLLPEELSELMASQHKPLYALQCLTAGINGSGANTYIKGIMDQNLTAMEDVVGGCERLLRTPLPLSYTRHTTRFLVSQTLFPACLLRILSRKLFGNARWRQLTGSFLLDATENLAHAAPVWPLLHLWMVYHSFLHRHRLLHVGSRGDWRAHRGAFQDPGPGCPGEFCPAPGLCLLAACW